MRRFLALTGLACVLALAGCGDDEDGDRPDAATTTPATQTAPNAPRPESGGGRPGGTPSSPEDYRAALRERCAAEAREVRGLPATPETPEGVASGYARTAKLARGRLQALEALSPPADLAAEHRSSTNVIRALAEALEGVAGQLRGGADQAQAVADFLPGFISLIARSNNLSAALDVPSCRLDPTTARVRTP